MSYLATNKFIAYPFSREREGQTGHEMESAQIATGYKTSIQRWYGNYWLVERLGRGGFGTVYLGTHRYLGTEAAIKFLQTRRIGTERQQFLAEARIAARLVHPHVNRVLDFGFTADDIPFLVMDYAHYGSMRTLYQAGKTLSLDAVIYYAEQTADGLYYIHRRGLIHQDIKPENLLIGRNHQVQISDFGIAILARDATASASSFIAGTPAYMAPEQMQGEPCYASDQYALATVIYEWLSGTTPFSGSWSDITRQHFHGMPPPSLRARGVPISRAVESVIMRALAKEPEQRYSDVRAFVAALKQAARLTPTVHVPPERTMVRRAQPAVRTEPLKRRASLVRKSNIPTRWGDITALLSIDLLIAVVMGLICIARPAEASLIIWPLCCLFCGIAFISALAIRCRQAVGIVGCIFSFSLFAMIMQRSPAAFLASFIVLLALSAAITLGLSLCRS